MRVIADLIPYIHSYEKYFYIYDLNQKEWIKVSNEQINQKFAYDQQCIYCIYDVKERGDTERILPRCNVDVSTRSRFFKHLQELESELSRRLVCFEDELESFQLIEQSNRKALLEAPDKRPSDETSKEIDKFLNEIRINRKRPYSSIQEEDHDSGMTLNIMNGFSLTESSTNSICKSSSTKSSNQSSSDMEISSDEENSSKISLSLTSPTRSPLKSSTFVKSIWTYEQEELNGKSTQKGKRHSFDLIDDRCIIINQIINDKPEFLCFLNEI